MEDWLSQNWLVAAALAVGVIVVGMVLKTFIGAIVRYLMFIGFAAIVYKMQTEAPDYSFVTLEFLPQLAAIAAMAFVPTLVIHLLFLRRSRLGVLLFPVIGFGMVFAISSAFAY